MLEFPCFYFKFYLLVFFLIFTNINAENKNIVFIDIDYLLNNSDLGKKALKKIDDIKAKNLSNLKEKETILLNKEKEIKKKQNIISKEELKKEIDNYDGIIIGGDFNIIPNSNDVGNPEDWGNDALYRLEIRKEFRKILNLGFKDSFRLFNTEDKQYTFWDYTQGSWQRNKGLRIDHFLITDSICSKIKNVEIDKFTRGLNKPSDHSPIRVNF